MTTTIKAIQTRYAGHHFRSRLEARWAVFFDHMSIPWQYEPEGFELPPRLSNGPTPHWYLPDFWLPDHGLWVEVKGQFTDEDLLKTLDCLAALSCNGGGGRHDQGGHDSVVLGPVLTPDRAPVGLCMNKGLLSAEPWTGQTGCQHQNRSPDLFVGSDCGGGLDAVCEHLGPERVRDILLGGLPIPNVPPGWNEALDAARCARFEHGAQ